jgi:hypothetical protein
VPRVDELRARQKLDGKPTPSSSSSRQVKEELRGGGGAPAAEAERDAALARVPNLPHETTADGSMRDEDAIVVRGVGRAGARGTRRRSTSPATTWSAARDSGARFGLITGGAALLRLRSTASRSTGL